jgi:hypothetical protein
VAVAVAGAVAVARGCWSTRMVRVMKGGGFDGRANKGGGNVGDGAICVATSARARLARVGYSA